MTYQTGSRVELQGKARDIGKNGQTLARFNPDFGRGATVTDVVGDKRGTELIQIKLDKPNFGTMWVMPPALRPLETEAA
jgi:hypothetical protein